MHQTHNARETKRTIDEAIQVLDTLLSIGDREQRAAVGLDFQKVQTLSLEKEKYMVKNREIFLRTEALINSLNDTGITIEPELKKACFTIQQKAQLLKFQNMENMSLLNQIKSFLCMCVSSSDKSLCYNGRGVLQSHGKSSERSFISKKV